MFVLYQAFADRLAWIPVLYILFYRMIRKNLGDITSIMLKNKSCSVFLLEKEYLDEGTDAFNVELMKFDR